MGFRFRKTIGLIPGVRVNLSKTGVSASVGGKGATVNIGTKGATGTVGLPGTGMSYRQPLRKLGWGLILLLAVAAAAFYWLRHKPPTPTATGPSETPLAVTPREGTAIVNAPSATCRETPGRDGKVALKLGRGDIVDVVAREGAWTKVKPGAFDCWVSNRTIKASAK